MMALVIIGGTMILLAILYAFILILAMSGIVRLQIPAAGTHTPSIFTSIIIPVRNEEDTITECLKSIIHQTISPKQFEVIISDDFSEDKTVAVIRSFIAEWPQYNWVIISGDEGKIAQSGKKGAINHAILRAQGALVITTDADTYRGEQWLSSIMTYYKETGAKMILGPVAFDQEQTLFQKLQSLEFLGIMGVTAGLANQGMAVMCNGANLGYEKEVFHQAGGFGENKRFASGDDQFLLWTIKKKYDNRSIRFLLDQDAIVTTPGADNLRTFFMQRLRWVSKSRGYRDGFVLFTGVVTYLFQAALLAGFFLGFLSPIFLYLSVGLLLFKILVDFPLVFFMGRFFRKQRLWPWYIPAQIFQILYVTLTAPLAFIIPVKWKGRKI
ncbi:MAG: glycosyltransferase [Bacteroidetes bacterium]|nr:glycosyltransferase [Bacteroidota bacterium]